MMKVKQPVPKLTVDVFKPGVVVIPKYKALPIGQWESRDERIVDSLKKVRNSSEEVWIHLLGDRPDLNEKSSDYIILKKICKDCRANLQICGGNSFTDSGTRRLNRSICVLCGRDIEFGFTTNKILAEMALTRDTGIDPVTFVNWEKHEGCGEDWAGYWHDDLNARCPTCGDFRIRRRLPFLIAEEQQRINESVKAHRECICNDNIAYEYFCGNTNCRTGALWIPCKKEDEMSHVDHSSYEEQLRGGDYFKIVRTDNDLKKWRDLNKTLFNIGDIIKIRTGSSSRIGSPEPQTASATGVKYKIVNSQGSEMVCFYDIKENRTVGTPIKVESWMEFQRMLSKPMIRKILRLTEAEYP